MPECHKCPHNGKQSQHCISCKGPSSNQSNHGKSHVSWERLPEKHKDAALQVSVYQIPKRFEPLAAFMRIWLSLSLHERNLLSKVIAGETQTTLAHSYKITPQAIQQRIILLASKYPEINALLKLKVKALR